MTTTNRGDVLDALALARAYVTGDQEGLEAVWTNCDRAAVLTASVALWCGHLLATTGGVEATAELLSELSRGVVDGQENVA